MSTEREDGRVTWICDECGQASDECDKEDFKEFWERVLKPQGWRALKDVDVWAHYCPDCSNG